MRLLALSLTLAMLGCTALVADEAADSAAALATPPPLAGTFVDLADGTYANVDDIGAAMQTFFDLGMRLIIIDNIAYKPKPPVGVDGCALDVWQPAGGKDASDWDGMYERVGRFLLEAQKHPGMKVVLGGAFTMTACRTFATDRNNRRHASRINRQFAQTIETSYAPKFNDVIAGYYIPDETSIAGPDYIESSKTQAESLRNKADRIIYSSPYLGLVSQHDRGYPDDWGSPAHVAALARTFVQATGVNVLLYQDSVGVGMMNLSKGFDAEPTLADYMKAIGPAVSSACAHCAIYSIVELFDGLGSSADIMRIRDQLGQARQPGVSGSVCYIAQIDLFNRNVYGQHPQAVRLYDEYRALLGIQGKIIPYSGVWSGLFDGVTGNPRLDRTQQLDSAWLPQPGNVVWPIDLGKAGQPVDHVSLQVLASAVHHATVPAMRVRFANAPTGPFGAWTDIATQASGDGAFVLANDRPLGASGRYVELKLVNATGGNLVSELTFTTIR